LADACWAAAHLKEGLDAIAEAFARIESTGERVFEAQLYRLKGEMTLNHLRGQRLSASIQQQAEECFRKSLEIARRQAARSFELSAAISLARLLHDTKRCAEARTMLAEIYEQFTEGFDTAYLKDARALLEELGRV
jgi:hypothetical protein